MGLLRDERPLFKDMDFSGMKGTLSYLAALLAGAMVITVLATAPVLAEHGAQEYHVKAAFLYNFTRFIEWPQEAASENPVMPVCVIGKDPFGTALDIITGKEARGRKLVVRRYRFGEPIDECAVVFFGAGGKEQVGKMLDELRGRSVLTISEQEGFAASGGIIEFFIAHNKVRFRINQQAAKRAKLEISSKLLRLAELLDE